MATIKSHTDLPQSKTLSKILPHESADMHYNVVGDAVIGDYQSGISSARSVAKAYKKNPDEFAKKVIPCWSLSALLDVLPNDTDIVKAKADAENEKYMCTVGVKDDIISTFGNNPVDACYEMILKLKERKML